MHTTCQSVIANSYSLVVLISIVRGKIYSNTRYLMYLSYLLVFPKIFYPGNWGNRTGNLN
jgi:hypothetical protein